jgi:hypothetical protein
MRQTDVTTQQMKQAPLSATFVWCNERTRYPTELAKTLGRNDLVVRPLSWLEPRNVVSRRFPAVIVDHATRLDPLGYAALDVLIDRGVPCATGL